MIQTSPWGKIVGLVIAVGLSLSISCSTNTNVVDSGTTTQTTNCDLGGILYGPDGLPVDAGTKVRVHPRLIQDDSTGPIYAIYDTATVFTDSLGRFAFDTLDSGIYVIEADNGVEYVLIDSIVYSDPDSNLFIVDTLREPGSITGYVRLASGGDPRAMLIVVWGLERLGQVQSDGSFSISRLAKGRYTLRFIPLLSNYGIIDVPGVIINPGETTNLDTVSIPYTGIPIPSNLKLGYDTLKQTVTLQWNKEDAGRVVGYNIYRTQLDGSHTAIKINGEILITDTIYVDSTSDQGETYEYRVAAIDTAGNEGVRSAGVKVTIFSAFSIVDSLVMGSGSGPGQFGNATRFTISSGGMYYLIDKLNNRLQKMTPQGSVIFSKGDFGLLTDVALETKGSLFVIDYTNNNVTSFDTAGILKSTWKTQDSPISIAIDSHTLYVATETAIEWFDSNGARLGEYYYPESFRYLGKEIKANIDGDIIGIFGDSLYLFNTTMNSLDPICQITVDEQHQDPQITFLRNDIVCVSTYNLSGAQNTTINVIGIPDGDYYASLELPSVITDIHSIDEHILVGVARNGVIYHLKSELKNL